MSRHKWTRCEQLPIPLELVDPDDGNPAWYQSRPVLLYFRDGTFAVGWVELIGDWEARVDGDGVSYVGEDGSEVQWASDDNAVYGDAPTHWMDLPSQPEVTGFAIMASDLREPKTEGAKQ